MYDTYAFAELLTKQWLALFKRAPKTTVAVTIVVVLAGITAGYWIDRRERESREVKRLQSQDYTRQVESLSLTRANLESLIEFVDERKKQLEQSERALSSIRSEHEKLKPLVEADQKVIDAFFAAQEARNQAAQSKERWIGFGLGVLASLIASVVWGIVIYSVKGQRRAPG